MFAWFCQINEIPQDEAVDIEQFQLFLQNWAMSMELLTQKSVIVSGGVVNEENIDKSLAHLAGVCDVLEHVVDVTAPILRKHFTSWAHHLDTALKTFDAKNAVSQSGDLGFIQKVGKMTELKTKITGLMLEWINFG